MREIAWFRDASLVTILVFTPTFGDGPQPRTLVSVSQQTYTNYAYEISYHNPYPGERNFANVVAQYQRAWQMALAGGYDALVTVEHDMILPPDALEKLNNTDAGVVYGVYMLRHGVPTLSAWQYTGKRNMGMSLSLYPKVVEKARQQGWLEVCGVGWGCTLIRREVLQRLTVHCNDEHDAGDLGFATDCIRSGIRQIARFDVLCGHITPEGVLMPFENAGIVSRVYALQDVTANVAGQSKPMKKGSYYTIPVNTANELARAGYVRITNDTEQPDVAKRETAVDVKAAKRSKRNVS